MYFEFPCVNCAKPLKVSEEHRGRKVRCPYCHQGQVVQAPAPQPPAEDPLSFLEGAALAKREPKPGAVQAAGPGAGAGRPAPPPEPPAREETASGTDVSALRSGLIGLAVFVGVYGLLFPLRSWYLGGLLWNRGWVQFAEVFLAAWAAAILVLKARRLAVQRDSMLFDLLPESIAKDITPGAVDQFVAHIRNLPVKFGQSLLVNRVLRGLEHFGVLRSSSEVANRLASQSEIDSNAVSSSYTLVKVFIWAIPILGFIGTVIGIGKAVGSFSTTMSAASDIGALKESVNSVTSGLATAFDTTLLALVLSILVMFPMSSLQKSEQDLLNWVDEYCNENLLKRLKGVEGGPLPEAADAKALQAAIDAAMIPHQAELRAWRKKLEAIGDALGQQVAKGWAKVDEQMQAHHGQAMRELAKSVDSYQQTTERLRARSEEQAAAMTELVRQTRDAQQLVCAAMKDSAESIRQAGESVQRYFDAIQRGLDALNGVLAGLGEKQVVVQAAPRRRRFFGLLGTRDGA